MNVSLRFKYYAYHICWCRIYDVKVNNYFFLFLDSDLTMDDLGHPNGSPAHSGSHGNLASAADYDYLIKFLALGRLPNHV